MRKLLAITLGVAIAGLGTVALASRNSSGTYSVTASGTYPFVTGTLINSTTVNSIFSDLSTEMTDSLSRSGKGGMTAPLRCPDGSVSAPTLSFTNETGTGFYRIGLNDVGFALGGTKKIEVTSSIASFTPAVVSSVSFNAPDHWGPGGAAGNFGTYDSYDAQFLASNTVGFAVKADGTNDNMSRQLVNVADPSNPQHAATQNYVVSHFPYVTKVASNIVSPGTGWRAITGLTSPSYAANSVVSFSCTLLLTIASGNFALGINGPASPAAVNTVMVFRDSVSAAMDMNPAATTYDGGTLTGILTAAQVMHLYGSVTIGATPGALTARVNSSSGSFTIYAGSFCTWN